MGVRFAPYVFVSPFFLLFCVFVVYPLFYSIWLSMQDTAMHSRVFVGPENFVKLIHDPLFGKALGNTFYFLAGSLLLQLPLALVLALALNSPRIRGTIFFRFAFFSPVLIAGVFIAIIFGLIFDHEYGLLNHILRSLGVDTTPLNWIRNENLVMPAIVLAGVWRWAGFNMIYFLAGLQGIRQELYEAAAVDGASWWQSFLHVTLPGLKPVLVFVVVMSTIGSIQLFDIPYILLGGAGPNDAGLTVVMYLYRTGFQYTRLGYAATIGWAIFAIIFALSMVQMRILSRGIEEPREERGPAIKLPELPEPVRLALLLGAVYVLGILLWVLFWRVWHAGEPRPPWPLGLALAAQWSARFCALVACVAVGVYVVGRWLAKLAAGLPGRARAALRAAPVWLGYAVLICATAAVLIPLAWMVVSSLKPGSEIFSPPHSVIAAHRAGREYPGVFVVLHDLLTPDEPTLENYRRLFAELPFARFYVNSVFVASAQTLLTLFFCSLGGYAFAKFAFPGRSLLFTIVLGSMMIPFHVLLVPLFELMHRLHWFDTFRAIIIPFSASAFGIFLMRQYSLGIPNDLLDAARIDGASEFGIYWRVVLPLVKPALGALTIFVFMGSWNNFLWPLIVLHSDEKYTLPLGLANLVGVYSQEYGMLMAGTLLSTLPVILLFVAMQREFVSGITLGAVKE